MASDSLNTYLYLTTEQIAEGVGGVAGIIIYTVIVFYFNVVSTSYYHTIMAWIITWTTRKSVLNLYRMCTASSATTSKYMIG